MTEHDENNPLEVRFRSLRDRVEAEGGDLHISVTIGGVDVSRIYKITPLEHDHNLLGEQMDDVERLVDDPRFAEVSHISKKMREAETTLKLAQEVSSARGVEYDEAIAAFREFAIGGGLPTESHQRDLVQSVIDHMVIEMRDEDKQSDEDPSFGDAASPMPEG